MGKISAFTGLLERATSQLQLEPDWASILQICDCIRQQDVTPKMAVFAIKKKMFDKNPHVSKFALTVIEACMKNCGAGFHDEIATKEFMEEMRNLIRNNQDPVKEKALGLIQTWSHAFRNESKYKIIQDTYNLMKMEGCQFPAFKESDAMFSADCAPAWAEGDVCHMCRVKFGTFMRQHHCRKCGQVFCKKCSSKESIIPQFGIEREVRVCDPCYYQINPQSKSEKGEKSEKSSSSDGDLPTEYLNSTLSKESQAPPKRDPQQMKEQEEEEIQLAMALSLSQEEVQKEKKPLARSWPSTSSNGPSNPSSSTSKLYSSSTYEEEDSVSPDMDPDLARYLNRSYWEGRKEQQSSGYTPPSAPEPPQTTDRIYDTPTPYSNHTEPEEQVNEIEQSSETLVNTFRTSLDMLAEQMQTVSGKGKHIAMDATVQSLFQTVSAMHPQLLRMIEQQEEETGKYEALKERLGLVKEARGTLDDAREQHREKVRQQELEQDMLRRMQIEQKLELMRQQKAEYLAYQQRLQAERQMVLEQQHQQLRYQNYAQQQFAGQHAVTDGSVPYAAMGYMPPSSMPPPSVTQADGSPYSSLNYAPPSNLPPPSNMLPPGTTQSDGSPYSSLNYAPPSNLPPPSNMLPPGTTQSDGSPYSSLNNYIPPSSVSPAGIPNTSASIPGPTAPGGPNNLVKGNQLPPYNQPAPRLQQGYPPQAYPGMVENPAVMENSARSHSPHFGQAPPSYSQVDYASYGADLTNSHSVVNSQPSTKQQGIPDYLQPQGQEQMPSSTYQQPTSMVHPGQPNMTQQPYATPINPQPPQYAQATNQPPAPHAPSHYEGSQQGFPPQGNPQDSSVQPQHQVPPKLNNQTNQLPPQYSLQHQGNMQHPDPSGFPPPHIQQQQPPPPPPHQQQQMYEPQPQQFQTGAAPYSSPQQYQQPPQQQHQQPPQQQHQQQQPQQQHQQPPQQQHQQPQQQHQQPQQQHQQPQQQHQQPQQPQQQQQYQPPPQQQQLQNQYYQQQPQQPSGLPPQRQLSDLELISFD